MITVLLMSFQEWRMLLTTFWIPSAFVILISYGDLIPSTDLPALKLNSWTGIAFNTATLVVRLVMCLQFPGHRITIGIFHLPCLFQRFWDTSAGLEYGTLLQSGLLQCGGLSLLTGLDLRKALWRTVCGLNLTRESSSQGLQPAVFSLLEFHHLLFKPLGFVLWYGGKHLMCCCGIALPKECTPMLVKYGVYICSDEVCC